MTSDKWLAGAAAVVDRHAFDMEAEVKKETRRYFANGIHKHLIDSEWTICGAVSCPTLEVTYRHVETGIEILYVRQGHIDIMWQLNEAQLKAITNEILETR